MTDTEVSNKKVLKVALFGCGKMGLHHLRIIQSNPNAEVVGVADPCIETEVLNLIDGSKIRAFSDPIDLLKELTPDVVHVVTPPATHFDLGVLALEAGAHVYIEKPFALWRAEAEELFSVANKKKLYLCAGHQLLFEHPIGVAEKLLPLIGQIVHIESYFSFRPVRKSITTIEQLTDILPHPVYLLIHFLYKCQSGNRSDMWELKGLDYSKNGDVRALVSQGEISSVLVVTLRGRPVESYVRIAGTNGSLFLDFVRGTVIKLLGPGASAIDAILNPYKQAKQIFVESTKAFAHLARTKEKSYQGLATIVDLFYRSIIEKQDSPLNDHSIIQTVALCEFLLAPLKKEIEQFEENAKSKIKLIDNGFKSRANKKGLIVVSGGTGFLGREVTGRLVDSGWAVRVFSRRLPPYSQRIAGVDYHAVDLTQSIPSTSLDGVSAVVHCAAETEGSLEAHEANTVNATRNLLKACRKSEITRIIHISSIAVLKPSKQIGVHINEQTPVDWDNLSRGPYVWAKAEAEKAVLKLGDELGLQIKIIRPGPLVDYNSFQPPGRLGREIGSRFIVFGGKKSKLSICSVGLAAKIIEGYLNFFDDAPDILNLIEPDAPTREELVGMVLQKRPDLKVLWVPLWLIRVASPVLKLIQKIVFPRRPPIDIYSAFASEKYDTEKARRVISQFYNKRIGESIYE